MLQRLRPLAVAAAGSAFVPAFAQDPSNTTTVVVTGNPLGRDTLVQPSSVLAGEGLALRRSGTLGDTLDGLPGVAASGFGPNASRPVVRGLDGDRVRVLDNGGASVDASNLSFDHAVAIDPLTVERVEVLRGPAALLYGGSATGGVVNTVDNRIPRVAPSGLSGRAELRFGGAARERGGAAVLEGGRDGGLAWHVDAFRRVTGDQRVPESTPVEDGTPLEPTRRVRNSASDATGGAFGGGWVGRAGFLGAAVDTVRDRYGVTVEPDVTIRLRRDRLTLAGETRDRTGPFDKFSFQASQTRYEHREIEGTGAVGTTFSSRGRDLRAEARHAPVAGLRGVVGLQAEGLDFSALGEEAFVPDTRTRSGALFALEEWSLGPFTLSGGVRRESARVASDGDAADAADPRFGAPVERRFAPVSASVGLAATLGGGWRATASIGHTERAPAYYELYANGLHVATAAYERGDPSLGVERSRHLEGGLAWQRDGAGLAVNVWGTSFSRFIALDATGVDIDVDGTPFPEYRFSAVRARLTGAELEGHWRLAVSGWAPTLTGALDSVRGDNLDRGEPLPRLAPRRARLGLEAGPGEWRTGVDLRHAARQDRVPAFDRATPSWTMLDLWWRQAFAVAGRDAVVTVKLANATDRLGYNAAAVSTVRALSPLPGRALSASLRIAL